MDKSKGRLSQAQEKVSDVIKSARPAPREKERVTVDIKGTIPARGKERNLERVKGKMVFTDEDMIVETRPRKRV